MRLLAATLTIGLLIAVPAGARPGERACSPLRDHGIERLRAGGTRCSEARRVAVAWDERCTVRATSEVRSPCRARRYRCVARRSRFLTARVTCTRGDRRVRFVKAFLRRL